MLNILHLEDREEDAYLIEQSLKHHHVEAEFTRAGNRAEFSSALEKGGFDLMLADNALPGLDGAEAMKLARQKYPDLPMIAVSGAVTKDRAQAVLDAGASNYILKDNLWQLIAVV